MALWVCNACGTRYSVGASYCPNCTSTNHREDGEPVPKITKAGGPSYTDAENPATSELAHGAPGPAQDLNPAGEVGQDPASAPDTDGPNYPALTVVELRQLIHDRNRDRDEDEQLQVSGNKAELVERLQADDEEQVESVAGGDNAADDG